jgi:hypothetical protein
MVLLQLGSVTGSAGGWTSSWVEVSEAPDFAVGGLVLSEGAVVYLLPVLGVLGILDGRQWPTSSPTAWTLIVGKVTKCLATFGSDVVFSLALVTRPPSCDP